MGGTAKMNGPDGGGRIFAAAAFLLLLCAGGVSAAEGDGAADRGSGYRITEVAVVVPDVTLVGVDGRPVPLRAALDDGPPVMLQFVFTTCPTICPLLTGIAAKVREDLGKERERIRAFSITIDPEHDTPAVLREYAANFDADPGWRFLTGSLPDIVAVQKAFGSYLGNKMNHPPYTFLRRSPRDPWVRIDGIVHADVLEVEARKLLAARGPPDRRRMPKPGQRASPAPYPSLPDSSLPPASSLWLPFPLSLPPRRKLRPGSALGCGCTGKGSFLPERRCGA